MNIYTLIIMLFLLLPILPARGEPNWMRDLKEKADDVGRDVKERTYEAKRDIERNTESVRRDLERSTQNTRRNIERGVNEQTRRISEEAQRVQRQYGSQAARQIEEVSRRYGSQASREMSNLYQKHGQRIAQDVGNLANRHGAEAMSRCTSVINQYGENAGRNVMQAYNQYGKHAGDQLADAFRVYGPEVGARASVLLNESLRNAGAYMQDEATQKKAAEAIVTTAVLYSRLDSEKKRITKDAITVAADNIEVVDSRGRRMNLNQFTKEWIGSNAPYLRGTSIAEDPAEALTYGVIYGDTDYICNDMKLLRGNDGQPRSIRDAAIYEAGLDADKTLAALEMADNFMTLGDGEASADDLIIAAQTIEKLQASN